MAIRVEILDLGINNLASLRRGLADAGASNLGIIASSEESRGADLLVLPGVGAFGAATAELESRGLGELAQAHVARGGYLFGVCLGMQLLSSSSEESPGATGLSLISGSVQKLESSGGARVPNMGWSPLHARQDNPRFPSLEQDLDFYFVHSYALIPEAEGDIFSTSPFGDHEFVSSVLRDNVLGTQFHPEKSSKPGKQLLSNVLEWARG